MTFREFLDTHDLWDTEPDRSGRCIDCDEDVSVYILNGNRLRTPCACDVEER